MSTMAIRASTSQQARITCMSGSQHSARRSAIAGTNLSSTRPEPEHYWGGNEGVSEELAEHTEARVQRGHHPRVTKGHAVGYTGGDVAGGAAVHVGAHRRVNRRPNQAIRPKVASDRPKRFFFSNRLSTWEMYRLK